MFPVAPFIEFEARAKIGTTVMARRDFYSVPKGARGRVIGMDERLSRGYDLRILWLVEGLPEQGAVYRMVHKR